MGMGNVYLKIKRQPVWLEYKVMRKMVGVEIRKAWSNLKNIYFYCSTSFSLTEKQTGWDPDTACSYEYPLLPCRPIQFCSMSIPKPRVDATYYTNHSKLIYLASDWFKKRYMIEL